MDRDALDRQMLEAHAKKDGQSLVHLYTQAAEQHEAEGDVDAACFFLTHAFVFALEAGAPEARALNMRLAELGRSVLVPNGPGLGPTVDPDRLGEPVETWAS